MICVSPCFGPWTSMSSNPHRAKCTVWYAGREGGNGGVLVNHLDGELPGTNRDGAGSSHYLWKERRGPCAVGFLLADKLSFARMLTLALRTFLLFFGGKGGSVWDDNPEFVISKLSPGFVTSFYSSHLNTISIFGQLFNIFLYRPTTIPTLAHQLLCLEPLM